MESISFFILNSLDRGLDVAHQRLHMTRSGITGQGSLDRTATVVTDNNDEARAEVAHCVFDAAQSVVIDQVPRGADYEKVADVVVEDKFGRSARVGAADYDGKGTLRLRGFRSFGGIRFALRHLVGGETGIALLRLASAASVLTAGAAGSAAKTNAARLN
jgi:hypothetical protein